jgi:hypothetical protein
VLLIPEPLCNSGLLKKPNRLLRSLFQASRSEKLATNRAINDCCYTGADGMKSLPIHEANASLSEAVKRAQQQSQQLTSYGALVAFIRRSPLVGVDELDLERSSDFTRNMEL